MSILLLGILCLLVWWWMASLRAKETAMKACRSACDRAGVQLLDETVSLRRLGLARDHNGVVKVRRTYSFEFSIQGDDRSQGEAICLGDRSELVRAEWPASDVADPANDGLHRDRVIPFRRKDGTPRH